MKYTILDAIDETVDNKVNRTVLRLEAEYTTVDPTATIPGTKFKTQHGFVVPEGKDIKVFAVECAAQLEQVLSEPKIPSSAPKVISAPDKIISDVDVQAEVTKQKNAKK